MAVEHQGGGWKLAPADRVGLVAEPGERLVSRLVVEKQQTVPVLRTGIATMSGSASARYWLGQGKLNSGTIIGLPATLLDATSVIGLSTRERSDFTTARLWNVKWGFALTFGCCRSLLRRHEVVDRVGRVTGRIRLIGARNGYAHADLPKMVMRLPGNSFARSRTRTAPSRSTAAGLSARRKPLWRGSGRECQRQHDAVTGSALPWAAGQLGLGVGPGFTQHRPVGVPLAEPCVPSLFQLLTVARQRRLRVLEIEYGVSVGNLRNSHAGSSA